MPVSTTSEDPHGPRRRAAETATANRTWWDGEAAEYYVEHGAFLGDTDFVWGPERLREADARLLGDLAGRRSSRSAPARASARAGSPPTARRSWPPTCPRGMVATGVGVNDSARRHASAVPVRAVRRDRALPFADAAFDTVFTAYGVGAVRRGLRRRHGGGGPGAAAGRPVRLLDHPPDAVGLPGRPGAGRAHRAPLLLRPHAVRRAGRRRDGRRTSSTTAPSATGCARSRPPGSCSSTSSSRSGPRATTQAWGGWSPLRGAWSPGRRSSSPSRSEDDGRAARDPAAG